MEYSRVVGVGEQSNNPPLLITRILLTTKLNLQTSLDVTLNYDGIRANLKTLLKSKEGLTRNYRGRKDGLREATTYVEGQMLPTRSMSRLNFLVKENRPLRMRKHLKPHFPRFGRATQDKHLCRVW